MSRPDNQIWQVTTRTPELLQTYHSQSIGDRAIRIDREDEERQVAVAGASVPTKKHAYQKTDRQIRRGALAIWITLQSLADQRQDVSRFIPGRQKGLTYDMWALITCFNIGDDNPDIFLSLHTVANHALCLKDRPITRGTFPIVFHPDVLVQAVLHGDEVMVRRILTTNPDLTQSGNGIDFSGRQFQFSKDEDKNTALTAIQAAIAAGDFASNKNSTGLCELLFEALKRQHPDRCDQIFHDQALALYTKSLRFYARKQENKIRDLMAKQAAGEAIDDAVIQAAIQRHRTYLEALHSNNGNDLAAIISAHTNPDPDPTKPETLDAQKDHVFQVNPALIDAIANASNADIQAILNDPMIDSPLNNLLREFRAEFIKLSHQEIIFNPQHLINLFALYHTFYARVTATDQHKMKRDFFWDHLVEFAMCDLPAAKAQIFANPGLYHTAVENGEKNLRVFDYKYGGGSIFPPLVSPIDPHNKKLLPAGAPQARSRPDLVRAQLVRAGGLRVFQNLCRATTSSFQNLLRGGHQHAMRAGM